MRESDLCIGGLKGCYQKAIDEDDEKTMLDIGPNIADLNDALENGYDEEYDDYDLDDYCDED